MSQTQQSQVASSDHHVLIKSCLDRLMIEATRSSPTKDLKEAITRAVEDLSVERDIAESASSQPITILADNYWTPFKIALQANQPPRVREQALDGLQKMIAYKALRGALPLDAAPSSNAGGSGVGASLVAAVRGKSFESNQNDLSHLEPSRPASPAASTVFTPSQQTETAATETTEAGIPDATTTVATTSTSTSAITATTTTQAFLIDEIIHTVCTTFTGASTDEAVQLQVIKVLLTAIPSTACEVHGVSLLKALQTCFNIHIYSRNLTNQATAKASLTQMVNLVFSRMERYSEVLASNVEVLKAEVAVVASEGTAPSSITESALEVPKNVMGMLDDVEVSGAPTPSEDLSSEASESGPVDLAKKVMAAEMERAKLANGDGGTIAKNVQPQGPTPYDPTVAYYNELLRKDVFLALRLLCRLSMQSDQMNSNALTFSAASITAAATMPSDEVSPLAVKSRCLALEMLLSIFNNAGPVMLTDDLYSELVRSSLAASISRNAVATNPTLFELSLSIFLMVIRFFRAKLKPEVEVLLNMVYLHILEMGNSSYQQKSLVLQALYKISDNPQTLVDIYLNYDCDLATGSVFERIVNVCAKVAQGKEANLPQPQMTLMGLAASAAGLDNRVEIVRAQEKRLRLRGLMCLVAIVTSMAVWCSELGPSLKKDDGSSTENITPPNEPAVLNAGTPVGDSPVAVEDRNDSHLTQVETVRSLEESRAQNVSSESSNAYSPMTSTAANAQSVSGPRSFLEALNPTAQVNPVIVNKHHLSSVTLSHQKMYNFSNGSSGSLESARTLATGAGGAGNDESDAAQIEELAIKKAMLREAVALFNQKPEKGLKLFKKNGFLADDEPETIAKFLKTTAGLSKSAIGDYLGDGDPFMVKVMHSFTDDLDFTSLDFVSALRKFLQTFRLPGEAQKISRFMEKYADRYCENNPGVFANADTAYTLAYSVIMLNTDQHSPQIKNRMDKAAFIKNNRGINDNADLPDEYLGAIFDEINSNEIIMEEERAGQLAELAKGWGAAALNDRQKMELYRKEIAQIQKKSQMHLSKSTAGGNALAAFRSAAQPDLARPMFTTSSWPMMATFSLLFEGSQDEEEEYDEPWPRDAIVDGSSSGGGVVNGRRVSIVTVHGTEPRVHDLCLQGFANAIKVSAVFRMETERDAFVTSLCKLTGLAHLGSVRPKNVKAIKTLLALANNMGEYLDSSWLQVLKIISQMERLQLIGNRSYEDKSNSYRQSLEQFPMPRVSIDKSAAINAPRPSTSELAARKANPSFDKLIAEFTSQSTMIAVDKIFSTTTSLSGSAILHFFKAVCHVSLEEVGVDPGVVNQFVAAPTPTAASAPMQLPTSAPNSQPASNPGVILLKSDGPPRMYLLQKIVEIAYYNMHRIRYEWTQIWQVLQPYFCTVAYHPSTHVATFAIDALRQLSMKFLEREELGHFATQHEFLRSFEWIMKHNNESVIKELILGSIAQMISARASSIRSGWKPIFVVLARAAQSQSRDQDNSLVKHGFDIVQMIFKDHFSAVTNAGAFMDYVTCLADFALLKGSGDVTDEVVMGSIQLLQMCTRHLVQLADDESVEKHQAPDQKKASQTGTTKPHPSLMIQTNSNSQIRAPTQPDLRPSGYIGEDHFFLKWFPILSALSRVTIDSRSLAVRTRALDALFDTLKAGGHLFSPKYWKTVYKNILIPVFDDLREQYDNAVEKEGGGSLSNANREGGSALWIQALRLLVDLMTESFESIAADGGELLATALSIISAMLKRRDEKLATSGQICLHQFMQKNLGKFGKANCWDMMIDAITEAFRSTAPSELLNCEVDTRPESSNSTSNNGTVNGGGLPTSPMSTSSINLGTIVSNISEVLSQTVTEGIAAAKLLGPPSSLDSLDFELTIIKCVTHIEVLQSIRDLSLTQLIQVGSRTTSPTIIKSSSSSESTQSPANQQHQQKIHLAITIMPSRSRERILQLVYDSYAIARAFNADYDLRQAIWRKGLVQQMPNLVKQETVALSTHIRILFALYRYQGDPSERDNVDLGIASKVFNMLVRDTLDVFERFVLFLLEPQLNGRDISLWSPVVIMIFKELLGMEVWWDHGDGSGGIGNVGLPKCMGLKKLLPKYFRLGIRMMSVERIDVRQTLQEFMEKVGDELFEMYFKQAM
ncbi:Brefeldin A-inhibited guanine nucleotide-exchange protein 2 [Blyttiomyces sp. JEL0837]|nr:Brefeldin A-inhibited guanine nucleotide-exchange protein 2 [Blyttiomyces sp. JEL0837]